MPYSSEWVPPALFLEHNGVKVYHTYKDDDIQCGIRHFWYTTNEQGGEDDDGAFDVRDILQMVNSEQEISDAIKMAIGAGTLTQEGLKK